MTSYQTTAIVIGRTNFGEADRIIRLFSSAQGKMSVVAKGVRRLKSKAAGHLELFGEVELSLIPGRNLDTITSARLAWYPHQLATDFDRLGQAFVFGAMVDRLFEDRQPQPEVYALLNQTLRILDAGGESSLLELWFKLRLLSHLGYQPELGHCSVCGSSSSEETYHFDAERGGLVCAGCAPAASRPMTHDTIKLWRLIATRPYAQLTSITGAGELATTSLPYIDEFYQYHLGRSFNRATSGVVAYG